jgi:hypothetical protein
LSVIFISYRTRDEPYAVAGLGHLLRERFGSDRVFVDHASIPPADSIPETITAALDQARIVLALIGPGWLGDESSFEAGQRLIDRDDDWIRQELRYAFARGSSVLPILLDGTGHPTAAELPDDIAELADRRSMELRSRHLKGDVERIADFLAGVVPELRSASRPTRDLRYKSTPDQELVALGVAPWAETLNGMFPDFPLLRYNGVELPIWVEPAPVGQTGDLQAVLGKPLDDSFEPSMSIYGRARTTDEVPFDRDFDPAGRDEFECLLANTVQRAVVRVPPTVVGRRRAPHRRRARHLIRVGRDLRDAGARVHYRAVLQPRLDYRAARPAAPAMATRSSRREPPAGR